RYSRLGCLALAARVRRPPQDTPHPHRARSEAGSARQLLQRRCPDSPPALQLSLQHSSSQLRALPRAQPRPRDTGGSRGAHTASTEISPSLTCEHHVQRGKQVLTSTTIICPNSCPRWRSAQTCLCNSPRDAHSAIAPQIFSRKHERAAPDLVSLPRRSG